MSPSFGGQLKKPRGHKGHIVLVASSENLEVTKVTKFWGLAQKTWRSQRSQRLHSFGGQLRKPRGHKGHKSHIVLGASSENLEVTKVTKVTKFWGLAQKIWRSQWSQRSHKVMGASSENPQFLDKTLLVLHKKHQLHSFIQCSCVKTMVNKLLQNYGNSKDSD